ncbi:hypothetical protein LCGC14_3165530 [marine sediment metagenome]|uniref:Chemotaxis phosphatase CheX-like domain-containing protein n=1 Tax=marine sediment metagenome TaxID=412755 RepID=A0A0F8WBE9_9ZZZZ
MTTKDITVLISLVGDVQGVVLYGLSTDTGLALVSSVMGQAITEFDSLAQSGIAELGNVITGRATIKLSETGYSANISPPTLITGNSVMISTLDFARILVPLTTDMGEFVVSTDIQDNVTQLEQEADTDRYAGELITSICAVGDGGLNKWIAGFEAGQQFYYRQARKPVR